MVMDPVLDVGGKFSIEHRDGIDTTNVKMLLDSGSCSAMVSPGFKAGKLSLGQKQMCINTTIGQEERVVEEVKVSLLEADGKISNVRATISTQENYYINSGQNRARSLVKCKMATVCF